MTGLSPTQWRNIKRNTRIMHKALSVPCPDCKLTWHPLIMTFDHERREEKKFVISNLRAAPPEVFDAELAKCTAVCMNCHQMREYLRDLSTMQIGVAKREIHSYYRSLIPFLSYGALLEPTALKQIGVPVS